jgi:D-inositol-3-phosphate glycosyltransferase
MKILIVGGAQSASGYGRVIRHVGAALSEMAAISCVHVGRDDGVASPGPLLTNPYPYDFSSRRFLSDIVQRAMFDVLLVVHDIDYCASVAGLVPRADRRCAIVTYSPLEGAIACPAVLAPLREADAVVLYTRRDAIAVSVTVQKLEEQTNNGASRPRFAWIPHGLDRTTFRPILELPNGGVDPKGRDVARRKVLGSELASEICFLVLNANRNVARKRIDATLRVFAAFAADKPAGVRLLLRSWSRPGANAYDLPEIVRALGLTERIVMADTLGIPETLDDYSLNWLYNTSDIGINTSEGEGWGLIAFEHAASGAPQILPAHSAAVDLWSGYDGLVAVSQRLRNPRVLFQYAEIDEYSAFRTMERLYWDESFRDRASLKAREISGNPELDWSNIGEAWRRLVCEVVNARRSCPQRSAEP